LTSQGNRDEFMRVQEAFAWFERQGFQPDPRDLQPDPDEAGGSTLHPVWSAFEDATYEAPNGGADVVQIVRDFMRARGLEVRFDGEFAQIDAGQMAHSPAEIDRVLGQVEWDADALVDAVVIDTRKRGIRIDRGLVQTAVRLIKRNDRQQRLVTVMRPLFRPLSPHEQLRADEQW